MVTSLKLTSLSGFTAASLIFLVLGICRGGEVSAFSLNYLGGDPLEKTQISIQAALPTLVDHIIEDSPDLVTWHRVSSLLRPVDGVLNWQHVQGDYSHAWWARELYPTVTSSWRTRRFYRVREVPSADAMPALTSQPVTPVGRLSQPVANGPFIVRTSGNWTIRMAGTSTIITNPSGIGKYEAWGVGVLTGGSDGTGHENLNGKHLKDLMGGFRTLFLPDGTIITISNATVPGRNILERVSIYDGDQSHRLTTHPDGNGSANTVEMSVLLRRAGETEEPDGETGRILDTPNGMYLENIYNHQQPGNGQRVSQSAQPLGYTGGTAMPNQVDDYFDDPRLGHT